MKAAVIGQALFWIDEKGRPVMRATWLRNDAASEQPRAPGSAKDRLALSVDNPRAEMPTRLTWWISGIAVILVLLAPLLAVSVPPLSDYPNHLARSYIFANRGTHPSLNAMFAPHWTVIPNLAMDIILPPLMRVLPPLIAGKVILSLAVLLPVTGAVALSRVCMGKRSLWQFGSALVVYNALFLYGFINFQIAIGVALWGAAAWIYLSPRKPILNLVIGIFAAVAAFFCHLFGMVLFALLIGSSELVEAVASGSTSRKFIRELMLRGLKVGAALLVPAVLYLSSKFAQTVGVYQRRSPLGLSDWTLPVLGYSSVLSKLLTAIVCSLLVLWFVKRKWRIWPGAWVVFPVLIALYIALPFAAKGGYWIDSRVPVILGFLIFALLIPQRVGKWEAGAVTIAGAVLILGRLSFITFVWMQSSQDIADVRQVLVHVPPGSLVMSVAVDPFGSQGTNGHLARSVRPGGPQAWWHDAAFAIIDRDAFWPDVFAYPGQQPLLIRPPYDQTSNGLGRAPTDVQVIAPSYAGSPPPDAGAYLKDWNKRFDYVLLLNADIPHTLPSSLEPELQLVDRTAFAILYRVVRS